jgi:hypothetical protein
MRILETLALKGLQFRRHTSDPAEISLCCPFPGCDDTRYRLGINVKTNKGNCFNCGWRSGKKTIQKVLAQLRMEVGSIRLEADDAPSKENSEEPTLPEDFTLLHDCTSKDMELWDAKKYLLKRGVTSSQMKRHYIGVSLCGRFRNRIVVPVTYEGYFLGTINRDFSGLSRVRYLNSFGTKSLWNCQPTEGNGSLILAEGIFKALAVERLFRKRNLEKDCGFAAINGSSISAPQLWQLHKAGWKKVFLLPDPDHVGLEKALIIADTLVREKLTVIVPSKYPKKQADDMTEDELERVLTSGVRYSWVYEQRTRLRMRTTR